VRGARALVLLLAAAGLAGVAAAPGAAAHGAAPPREVDTRVLLDDDGLAGFGGCVEGSCPPEPHEGLDLLSLDARELRLPDGRPGLALAVAFQWQAEGVQGRSIRLQFVAGGQVQAVTFLGPDTDAPTVAGAERIVGPVPVGDGDPRRVEAWFDLATFGLPPSPGSELSNVTVQSHRGDTLDDRMPGGWYQAGVQVPHVPHSADPGEALEEAAPGRYTVKGPARLLDASPPLPDSAAFPRSYSLTVGNPLGDLGQSVTLSHGDPASFVLGPGEGQAVNVTLPPGRHDVTLVSDLGAWASFDLPFIARPANTTAPAPPPQEKDAPAPAAWPVALALLAAAAAARRRA
jgi:hypothetical protein